MPKAGFKRQGFDARPDFRRVRGNLRLRMAPGRRPGVRYGRTRWLSWVIGGVAVLLLSLVYAELDAAGTSRSP